MMVKQREEVPVEEIRIGSTSAYVTSADPVWSKYSAELYLQSCA